MPEISVLIPVRNGAQYIKDAIDSTLKQTYADFEFLIIDDGSEDDTVSIVESYADPRIKLIQRKSDYIASLNAGLRVAKGNYIARMDADDIMYTERLRIQLKRMEVNPDISVCASWAKNFKDDGMKFPPLELGYGYVERPVLYFLKCNFIGHSTVMLRKSFLDQHGLRYEDYCCTEDFKLWTEVIKCGGKIYVEPQHLMFLRKSDSQITVQKRETVLKQAILVKQEILNYCLSNIADNKLLMRLYEDLKLLVEEELISWDAVFSMYQNILDKKITL